MASSTEAYLAILSVTGLVVSPLVAYISVSRKLSGNIQTSEAADLWRESAAIREDYRLQLKSASEHMNELEEANRRVLSDMSAVLQELSSTKDALAAALREQDRLHKENAALARKVEDLEARMTKGEENDA